MKTKPISITTGSKSAVIYLRVSTKGQTERDGDPEGYSIPAQRDACTRRAKLLDSVVVKEFVDSGESAKSADRPALQDMLRFVASEKVDFIIVHKIDRLARSREDDLFINSVFVEAGTTLISCSENIDRSPSGLLLHGIMASIAEFYSQNLAAEVKKGMSQKAKNGGTNTKAPIGYQNVRNVENGRDIRSVEIDPERGPLITWAFEAYASGDYSLRGLTDELVNRGLTQRSTRSRPERLYPANRLHDLLQNKYYLGIVTYMGEEFEGRHERLTDPVTFELVQRRLQSRRRSSDRTHRRNHYLKGSLRCARCHSPLGYCVSRGNGGEYAYFFCWSRHERKSNCDLPHISAEKLENAVIDCCFSDQVDSSYLATIRKAVLAEFDDSTSLVQKERAKIAATIARLNSQRVKLADMALAGAVPSDIAHEKQVQLQLRLSSARTQLEKVEQIALVTRPVIEKIFDLCEKNVNHYRDLSSDGRKEWNMARYEALEIDIDDDGPFVSTATHTPIFGALATAEISALSPDPLKTGHQRRRRTVTCLFEGSRIPLLVGRAGLEPATPCVSCKCATRLRQRPLRETTLPFR
jgi:site-specific DNA recombinase